MAVLSCIDSVMAMTEQMTAEHSTEKYMVPALERGLRLLQEFGHQNETLGAPELARRLELPRATIFRMLNTLEAMGFLQRVGGQQSHAFTPAYGLPLEPCVWHEFALWHWLYHEFVYW